MMWRGPVARISPAKKHGRDAHGTRLRLHGTSITPTVTVRISIRGVTRFVLNKAFGESCCSRKIIFKKSLSPGGAVFGGVAVIEFL